MKIIPSITVISIVAAFLLLGVFAPFGSSQMNIDGPDGLMAQPPSGWIHRPLMEFFTGLSCPACMGDSPTADSPEKAFHDTWLKAKDDESVPQTALVFHELNGGGVDALRTEESEDRMRYYQPGLAGTPDIQFDGGYFELGGFSSSTRDIDEPNIQLALEESRQRYNNKPLRPMERLTWSFPYIWLEIDQFYNDGEFTVVGKVTYDGNAKLVGNPQLQGSLFVFMVEDGVEAYSKVYDQYVNNDAVFRGYAIEDETFSMGNGDVYEFSGRYQIPLIDPEEGVPIKPQNMYAIAAVFDTQDTDSVSSPSDGNTRAGTPRALQSATSDSTAYDRENRPPKISSAQLEDDGITVIFEDEGGIALASLFFNTEAENSTQWTSIDLELQGEELCDDSGTCYAYSDPIGTARLDGYDGGPLYVQVLANDDQMAQGTSEVFSIGGESTVQVKGAGSLSLSGGSMIIIIGVLVMILGPLMYVISRKKEGNIFQFFSSKGTLAVIIMIGLIIAFVGGSSLLSKEVTTVPDFSVTDTTGTVHTPADYSGKVLVIDIMFTTCSVCMKEMPDVVEVYEWAKSEYGSEVEFLSVSVDKDDTANMMNDFQKRYGAEWPIGRDTSFIEKFDAVEAPKMFIIAPNGDVAYQHTGFIDKEEVKDAITAAHEETYKISPIAQRSGFVTIAFFAVTFGVLTFFSPCSFPMLPGYLSYYITSQAGEEKKINPIKGGTMAAIGIIAFFLIVAVLVALLGAVVKSWLVYLMPVIGFLLLLIGVITLIGKDDFLEKFIDLLKKPFTMLVTAIRGERQTEQKGSGGLFLYGFGYGAAASSCMAPAFIGVIFLGLNTSLGWLGAVLVFMAYTFSIATMMIVFSYMAATGSKSLEKFISSSDKVKRISGLLLVFAGAFVIWYAFWGYKYIGGFFSI